MRGGQTIRDAASWLRNHKYHNQCDGYLTSLTELLIIMSRFVGTVNPAFGTSSVESVDVSFMYPFAARGSDIIVLRRVQDIDFAALYRAYDDELMAWKNAIDERHKGEKESPGPSQPSARSVAPLTSPARRARGGDGDHAGQLVRTRPPF